ncbi:hypothetical protein JL722_4674 [Aureococcus anophagefferens]|nr:hypothetical protein JL722_4674 [Aureococcus anophagefferens]
MEGIGLDLMDAKALLAKAKRPAVKAVLSTFIREMTAKELELLGAADGSDDEAENCARPASRSDARARDPRGAASSCDFGVDSFDLRITDVGGKNYRLFVEALDKDIVPAESKILVKKNRVTVKLKKVKGEYSYDHWSDLKKKGGKAAKEKEKGRDPSAGIMDMMKDLYDNGDDNMRKIIGESMMKSQRGEKMDPKDMGPGEDDLGAKEGDLDVDADDITNDDFSMPSGLSAGLPKMPDLGKIPGMEDFKMPDGP